MLYIYLDTSFLSELAKAESGILPASSRNDHWIRLLDILRQGVKRGVTLCPASQFQIEEAMLTGSLFSVIVPLQYELSKEFYFRNWEDILVHQMAKQVLLYLKRPQDIDLSWKIFIKTPPTVKDPFKVKVSKLNVAQYGEVARQLRKQFGRNASYEEYYREEKRALLGQTFLNPKSDFLEMLIKQAKVHESEVPLLFAFINNPESVDSVPFINIFCSLWASTIYHEQTRKYEPGDLLDIVALACAIPYCQIVTTDTNMKNMVERLNLDKEYGVSIYSPTSKDLIRLEKELARLGSK